VVTGVARYVACAADIEALRPGEILLADDVPADWRPAIDAAAAIVTNGGGTSSAAARAARELGVPAVVGTVDGASRVWSGATLTVACDRGPVGVVYERDPSAAA
jgi:pyruvate,water dikinase